MKYHLEIIKYILLLVFAGFTFSANAQIKIPEKPSKAMLVNDLAGMLSADESYQLEAKLRAYNDSTSSEVVIVTVPSLNGENVQDVATEIGHKWQIGTKEKDNGIVLLVALNERKTAIATGYGMEARVTDGIANSICNKVIKPYFKQKQYFAGLDAGTDAIFKAVKGEFKSTGKKAKAASWSTTFILFLVIVVIFIVISFINKSKNGGGGHYSSRDSGAGDLLTAFALMNLFGGSSRGRSYNDFEKGSGDFGGFDFGGGDFGGGGSSGDW